MKTPDFNNAVTSGDGKVSSQQSLYQNQQNQAKANHMPMPTGQMPNQNQSPHYMTHGTLPLPGV
jgi:hypothetical protein